MSGLVDKEWIEDIDPNRRVFTLRILPNDNPHGTIQFALDNFVLEELDADATQYVTVSRL